MRFSEEEKGVFLVGAENKLATKYKFDMKDLQLEKLGVYKGHSNSVRNMQCSKSGKHLLTTCEDHSLRLWDYKSYDPLLIFSGHRDNVVSIILKS